MTPPHQPPRASSAALLAATASITRSMSGTPCMSGSTAVTIADGSDRSEMSVWREVRPRHRRQVRDALLLRLGRVGKPLVHLPEVVGGVLEHVAQGLERAVDLLAAVLPAGGEVVEGVLDFLGTHLAVVVVGPLAGGVHPGADGFQLAPESVQRVDVHLKVGHRSPSPPRLHAGKECTNSYMEPVIQFGERW